MRRTKTAITASAVALVAALGTSAAVAADGTGDSAAANSRCTTGHLEVSLSSGGEAGSQSGMSHAGQFLRFRNTGTDTCVLYGYPGLGLEGTGHRSLSTDAEWGSTYFARNPGKHTVQLQSGDSAWADLVWTQTGAHPARSSYLEVTPPGATTHRTVSFERSVDNGVLQVTALSDSVPHIG
ncbi:DUF4232 domain-containing protein [Streptomyces sp. NBC_00344]|uniref:DUF4232 domain-containing protein n=1 Tax=Streptomyces sp. NBC_00344 TaxID=2975720 RepID=UPI002E1C7D8B